jgi:hypothetical protein
LLLLLLLLLLLWRRRHCCICQILGHSASVAHEPNSMPPAAATCVQLLLCVILATIAAQHQLTGCILSMKNACKSYGCRKQLI